MAIVALKADMLPAHGAGLQAKLASIKPLVDRMDVLLRENDGWIQSMARRLAARTRYAVDYRDLAQAGRMAFVQRMRQDHDPEQGTPRQFTEKRVKWAMLDELRMVDPLSRDKRIQLKRVQRIDERLRKELCREPSDEELAERAQMGIEKLREVLVLARRARSRPLDALAEEDLAFLTRGTVANQVDALGHVISREGMLTLRDAINQLGPRHRMIIILYHFEEVELQRIGEMLGVTVSRACQLKTEALLRLRKIIEQKTEPQTDTTAEAVAAQ